LFIKDHYNLTNTVKLVSSKYNISNGTKTVTKKVFNTKDTNTPVLILLSLTTVRAESFQSSALKSDILKQIGLLYRELVQYDTVTLIKLAIYLDKYQKLAIIEISKFSHKTAEAMGMTKYRKGPQRTAKEHYTGPQRIG